MAVINGGSLVVKTLKKADVDSIFGLHGAHIDTLFQACVDQDVRLIDTRHEAAAGHAAEGYARTSDRLGVALVTAGGGFTNVITPLANAYLDRTSLLVVTGSGALRDDETNTLQAGIDQVAIATPITKWSHKVTRTDQIPRLVAQAIRIATSAPRGPVLLDIPWDILMAEVEEENVPIPSTPAPSPGGALTLTDADIALQLIINAKRPIIIVGSESHWGNHEEALATLAKTVGAPVFSDYEGLGQLGMLPPEYYGGLLQSLFGFSNQDIAPDMVLMVGFRFGLSSMHGSGKLIPHAATVVQIDPDARELGRLQSIAMGIQADAGASIELLALKSQDLDFPDRTEWRKQAQEYIARRKKRVAKDAVLSAPELHPLIASEIVVNHVDENTIVVVDGALTYLWLSEVISAARPAKLLCHGYLGSMGVGMGVATGAQAAATDQPVILVTGDGAIGYSLGEFDTLVRNNLPLIVIVMNNQSWGATQHFQKMAVGPDRITKTMLLNGAYHQAAQAFGAEAYYAETAQELENALDCALKAKRPACINVRVALDPVPPEEKAIIGLDPF